MSFPLFGGQVDIAPFDGHGLESVKPGQHQCPCNGWNLGLGLLEALTRLTSGNPWPPSTT